VLSKTNLKQIKKSREFLPARDCASNFNVLGGLLNKIALEGVSADHGCWIDFERAGLKEKK